jgi:hypothetical protein
VGFPNYTIQIDETNDTRVFAGALEAASLGMSAARAWGAVASAVRDAAAAADHAGAAAAAAAATFSKDSVPRASARGIAASNDLKRRGAEMLAKSEGKTLR